MISNELPSYADAETWQAIALQQHKKLVSKDAELSKEKADRIYKEALIAKLTAEIAQLKRLQFGRKAESFVGEQRQLFDETIVEDIAAIEQQLQEVVTEKTPSTRHLNVKHYHLNYHGKSSNTSLNLVLVHSAVAN